jgi:hypothetical protein
MTGDRHREDHLPQIGPVFLDRKRSEHFHGIGCLGAEQLGSVLWCERGCFFYKRFLFNLA